MPSLHPAWRWGRVLLAPEAACRPFSPSLESQASSRPVTALTVAQPAPPGSLPLSLENAETPCHACPPAPAPSCLPSWSLQLPASVTLLSAWPLPLRLSRSHRAYPGSGCRSWRELRCPPLPAPPHPSRLSSSLPYVLDPGPSRGALALAASSLCPSPAWAPGWSHPPALGSSLPASLLCSPGKVLLPSTLGLRTPALPQALFCSGGQGQPCRVHQIHTVTCSRTRVQGLEFPLFLLPSTLASILHSGSLPSAYKRVFFPPPRPVLWFGGLAVVTVPGVPLWFSLTCVPRSGPCPHPSTLSRSSLPFTWPDPTASRH